MAQSQTTTPPMMDEPVAADWDTWERLYDEALEKYPEEWFVILRGVLHHTPDAAEMRGILRARGIAPGEVAVYWLPKPPICCFDSWAL